MMSSCMTRRLSPIGITSILANRIISMDDPERDFKLLGWYIMTVLAGLAAHGFIVLPLLYFTFTRKNPFLHIQHMSKALLTALGTASRFHSDEIPCYIWSTF